MMMTMMVFQVNQEFNVDYFFRSVNDSTFSLSKNTHVNKVMK